MILIYYTFLCDALGFLFTFWCNWSFFFVLVSIIAHSAERVIYLLLQVFNCPVFCISVFISTCIYI